VNKILAIDNCGTLSK